MSDKTVYIVHAVDTEGPIYEDLNATFERLREIIGVDMKPSYKTLEKLQNKEIDLDGKEEVTASFLRPSMRAYNESWHQITKMLERIMSEKYRKQFPRKKKKCTHANISKLYIMAELFF